jgi:WD40 repeat protein
MNALFKRALPCLLTLLLLAGSIPLSSSAAVPSRAVYPNEEITLDFNGRATDTVRLTFTPQESGFYLFYSTGKEDPVGSILLGNKTVAHCDDALASNFHVLCKLEEGLSYQGEVRLWGGAIRDDGLVTVKVVRLFETYVTAGASKAVSIDRSLPMALFRFSFSAESFYTLSASCDFFQLKANVYKDDGTITPVTSLMEGDLFSSRFDRTTTYYLLAFPFDTLDPPNSFTVAFEKAPDADSMTLNYVTYTAEVGSALQLRALFAPEHAAPENVSWSSSSKEIATVSAEGEVRFWKKGSVTITARSSRFTASCSITVKDAPALSPCHLYPVLLKNEDDTAIFLFSPDVSGRYCFLSSDKDGKISDPSIELYDLETEKLLGTADDDDGYHFRLIADLEAGKSYQLELFSYDNMDSNSFNLQIKGTCGEALCHFAEDYVQNEHGHEGFCIYCGEFAEEHAFDGQGLCVICGYQGLQTGDINKDGAVDVSDVTELLKILSGTYPQAPPEAADLDGNGVLDVSDVTELLKILSGTSSKEE